MIAFDEYGSDRFSQKKAGYGLGSSRVKLRLPVSKRSLNYFSQPTIGGSPSMELWTSASAIAFPGSGVPEIGNANFQGGFITC